MRFFRFLSAPAVPAGVKITATMRHRLNFLNLMPAR